jgi:hypothetical protein
MSKRSFDQIAEGLAEAIAIARGQAEPAALHIPPESEELTRRIARQQSAAKTGPKSRGKPIPDDEAKARIKAHFENKHGQTVYPSDVADEIRLDYDRVLRLITELESDGKITRA